MDFELMKGLQELNFEKNFNSKVVVLPILPHRLQSVVWPQSNVVMSEALDNSIYLLLRTFTNMLPIPTFKILNSKKNCLNLHLPQQHFVARWTQENSTFFTPRFLGSDNLYWVACDTTYRLEFWAYQIQIKALRKLEGKSLK